MDAQSKGIERRMVHRLLVHWRDAQGDGAFPSLDAVLKRDLGDIGPSIFVLRVADGEGEPAFTSMSACSISAPSVEPSHAPE